jgi:hypothetical protein
MGNTELEKIKMKEEAAARAAAAQKMMRAQRAELRKAAENAAAEAAAAAAPDTTPVRKRWRESLAGTGSAGDAAGRAPSAGPALEEEAAAGPKAKSIKKGKKKKEEEEAATAEVAASAKNSGKKGKKEEDEPSPSSNGEAAADKWTGAAEMRAAGDGSAPPAMLMAKIKGFPWWPAQEGSGFRVTVAFPAPPCRRFLCFPRVTVFGLGL